MGVYNAAVITNNGLSLIAQAAAGQGQIVFTSAQTSSYAYPESTDFANLTSLQDVVQTQTSISAEVFNDTLVQATVRFDNSAVTSQYLIQTIGLFAQLGDSGSPVLFSVVTATTPDQMPAQSAVSPSAFVYVIQSTVQQASSLVVTTNPAGTATVQDIHDIEYPQYNDSGIVSGITSFPAFLATLVSGMNFFDFFANLKAGLQYVLHKDQLVSNVTTNDETLPASAAAVYQNAQSIGTLQYSNNPIVISADQYVFNVFSSYSSVNTFYFFSIPSNIDAEHNSPYPGVGGFVFLYNSQLEGYQSALAVGNDGTMYNMRKLPATSYQWTQILSS